MSSLTHSSYSELLQAPEADPITSDHEWLNAESEKPPEPQLTKPSYRAISPIRTAILLGSIIAGNYVCGGLICLCLWKFSQIGDLTQRQKRAFNTLSLLLSAILGFGIGFLCDRIGLLARGTVLQRKSHSIEGVCITI